MEKEKLIRYVEQGLSAYKIAEKENVSKTTITYWLNKYELITKTNKKNIDDKYKCIKCKELEPSEFNKKGLCIDCEIKYNNILTENRRLRIKFSNKQVNSKKENIPFELTLEDFIKLANDANITSKDMSIKGFHLARFNDSGSYKIGNCRFIYYKENYDEKKQSDKVKEKSRINISNYNRNETKKQKKIRIEKANLARKKWWESLSVEEQAKRTKKLIRNNVNYIDEKEIKRRHNIIKQIPDKFGRLTKASKILGITPQVIGRFLKKYPLPKK